MRYRARRTKKSGREFAQAHIRAGVEFSDQVGEADVIVKDAFFSLNGKALMYLLDRYEDLYGKMKRDYAQETIPKWRSGERKMSGDVAKRLFDLMPPLMPIDLKHQIVEKIWKRYGPHSKKYVYVGPDADRVAAMHEIQEYFASITVVHGIPTVLERRFDWLSDNDVTVKQQLLNYFMDEQRKLAVSSSRLNLGMIIDQMNAPSARQISKLSHTAFVGNHQLEIKADALRTGFMFSDSDRNMTRPTVRLGWQAWIIGVALMIGLFAYFTGNHSTTSSQLPTAQQVIQTAQADQQGPVQQERPKGAEPNLTSSFIPEVTPAPKHSESALHSITASKIAAAPVPVRNARAASVQAAAAAHIPKKPISVPSTGCSDVSIASVEDGGATIRLSNGNSYTVSTAGAMRYSAGLWSTGDAVNVCNAAPSGGVIYASIANAAHYTRVQASLATSVAASQVSCNDVRLTRVSDGGATIDTTDGGVYRVSAAGAMRYSAGLWSTGDAVQVCRTTLASGAIAAAIANPAHYAKVQATFLGKNSSTSVRCKASKIASVRGEGDRIFISDGTSYTVSSAGAMRYTAGLWTTGETVTVCEARAPDGSTAASIANSAHYSKVQATRS